MKDEAWRLDWGRRGVVGDEKRFDREAHGIGGERMTDN